MAENMGEVPSIYCGKGKEYNPNCFFPLENTRRVTRKTALQKGLGMEERKCLNGIKRE